MTLGRRIADLEQRTPSTPTNLVVWYTNPLDGEPEPRPEGGPDDLFFEVVYVNPPVYEEGNE